MAGHKDHRIARRVHNPEIRKLVAAAIKAGTRYRTSKGGVIFYGPDGVVTIHFTVSDHRAGKNIRAQMRKSGIDYGEKQ